ncbi:MAG: hypothetical protein ABIP65_07285 [Vicinamibacterales bacterium]
MDDKERLRVLEAALAQMLKRRRDQQEEEGRRVQVLSGMIPFSSVAVSGMLS